MSAMDLLEAQSWAYIRDLPTDIDLARDLLSSYSEIPPEDIDDHLMRLRDEVWKTSRMPFIGRWRFLYFTNPADLMYQQVLFRLTVRMSEDALLDIGCGLGQFLRQLRANGAQGSQLHGLDIDTKLIDLGYDLFRDRHHLGATFVVANMRDPDDKRMDRLNRSVTIIHAGSFFHLFTWTQQLYIGRRLVGFLKPGTKNGLIYGKQAGSIGAGHATGGDNTPFIHNQGSLQELWDEVGSLTRTRWRAYVEPAEDDGAAAATTPGLSQDVQPIAFAIYQIF